jgi:transposase
MAHVLHTTMFSCTRKTWWACEQALEAAARHEHNARVRCRLLTLRHLPPYSPELNPAEMLWRELRQRYLSNRVYPDAAALDTAVSIAWLR